MCGIFGAIGQKINPGTIRALALINRERGTDALGFYSNSGKYVKRAGDALACLGDNDFHAFIEKSCSKGWFIAGHTRAATSLNVTSRDAHPFRYGRIVGAHNGIVTVPRGLSYRVDSEYLIDSLNKTEGDYQKAFADILGYWVLTWFDGESFFMQAHKNEVALGTDDLGTWYYSSDWQHLEAAAHIVDNFTLLSNGDTIRFSIKCRKFQALPKFHSEAVEPVTKPMLGWWNKEDLATGLSRMSRKERRKIRRALKKGSLAERLANKVENTDPFYYDDDERWAGVDDWSNYVRDYDSDGH